jgi:hypothetical protein
MENHPEWQFHMHFTTLTFSYREEFMVDVEMMGESQGTLP